MAKVSESVSVSATTLESSAGVFQLAHVAGVRLGVVRGSYAGRWLGLMSLLIAVGYGGCFMLADALTGQSGGGAIVAVLFFGGLGLYGWSAWLAPARFLVVLNLGGNEVTVAEYRDHANAERVLRLVHDALAGLRG